MGILDLLYPKKCLSCGKPGYYLCRACRSLIPWHTEAICLICGKRAIGGYSHPICLKSWGLDRAILLAHYQGPVRKLIQGLKYRRLTSESKLLVDLIVSRLDRKELRGYVVTAVPLHFLRQFGRGFNQSEVIGRGLAGRLKLKFRDDILYRQRNTKSQVKLGKSERAENVRHAFAADNKLAIKNAKILLFDDVITSGVTVRECAKVLKRSGASQVWALALAHG